LSLLVVRTIGLAKIMLWSVPIVCLLALAGAWRGRRNPRLLLLTLSALLTLVGFVFVPFDQGHGWGFRYFHSAWLAVPLLATAALFGNGGHYTEDATDAQSELRRLSAACALLSLLILTPLRLYQVHDYIGNHLRQLPQTPQGSAALLIVNSSVGYYSGDLVQNDPFLRNRPMIMISRGRKQDLAMLGAYFPRLVLLHRDARGDVWGPAVSPAPVSP
jgi:hypothetical protein